MKDERMTNGRPLPYAEEAEQSVLGAALQNTFAAAEIAETLAKEDFYNASHGRIFEAIAGLVFGNVPVDLVTTADALKRNGMLEAIGGRKYLAELSGMVPAPSSAPYYANLVREKSILRQLIEKSREIIARSFSEEDVASDVLNYAGEEILKIGNRGTRSEYHRLPEVLRRNFDHMIELSKTSKDGLTGLDTGFPELNKMTRGLQPSDLIILAARPSMGKTSLALNIAANAAFKTDAKVMIFSLEMDELQLGMRLLSSEAMIDSGDLQSGKVFHDQQKVEKLAEAQQALSQVTINIDSTSGIQISEIRNKCRRMHQKEGLDLVVVDYLQLMDFGGNGKNSSRPENRQQEIATLSRMLKQLAKEMKCPFIVLSQLSRAIESRGKNKQPQLSDLRESGAIEQDADIVMFIYQKDETDENESRPDPQLTRQLYIAKHRNGDRGEITLQWLAPFTKFAHYDPATDPRSVI
ncbi:replicative DNA helicase [Clostridia bacterium]|nr:replicative DNA helicase [Clostridia bacterium]